MISFTDKIIAHRGESFMAPENSLSAITQAWNTGAKAVEIDIRLTADNKIVVIHDKHTGRVGNKKLNIAKSQLVDLKAVDIGVNKSLQFKNEKIPTLTEVIQTIPDGTKLIIEIKCGNEIVNLLIDELKQASLQSYQIEIICFDINILKILKQHIPQYKMLWLLNLDYYLPHWLVRVDKMAIIKTLENANIDGINVWAGKTINGNFVNYFKKEGYSVYTWTVNDPLKALSLLYYGVDSITTDRAEWLTRQLNKVLS